MSNADHAICRTPEAWQPGDRIKTDRSGCEYAVIHAAGSTQYDGKPPEESYQTPRADPGHLDHVYRQVAEAMHPAKHDLFGALVMKSLLARDLTRDEVDRLGYACCPYDDRLALQVKSIALNAVPGFWEDAGGAIHIFIPINGLVWIPVRDVDGRIIAVRVRTTDINRKYVWWSMPDVDYAIRPHFSAQCHVPLHTQEMRTGTVVLTEGEVKADVFTLRTGVLAVSIPGVGQWSRALPVLKELCAKRVVLAWDADARKNPGVAGSLQRCAVALSSEGYEIAIAVWPEDHKGLDDLVVGHPAGAWTIDLHEGPSVWEKISDFVASSGAKPDPAAILPALLERLHAASEPVLVVYNNDFVRDAASLPDLAFSVLRDAVKKHGVSPIGTWDKSIGKEREKQESAEKLPLPESIVFDIEDKIEYIYLKIERGVYPFDPVTLQNAFRIRETRQEHSRNINEYLTLVAEHGSEWDVAVSLQKCPPNRKPVLVTCDEHLMADEATIGLLKSDEALYQRGFSLVNVLENDNRCTISDLKEITTRRVISKTSFFYELRPPKDDDDPDSKGPPWHWIFQKPPYGPACGMVHDARSWPGMKTLRGIATHPVMRPDGSILNARGYDSATGLYATFDPIDLPEHSTLEDAQVSIELLKKPLADFPFRGCAHANVALAALLTLVARPALPSSAVPFFAVDGSREGVGKGLLCSILGIIALDREMTPSPLSKREEEIRKTIMSFVIAGTSPVLFDNVNTRIDSPSIAALITAPGIWADRVLGKSERPEIPYLGTVFADGINLSFSAEIARRVAHCRLESVHTSPERRDDFAIHDVLGWVRTHRLDLLRAACVVLQAYVQAGRPDMHLRPWGSFDEWSSLVRGALVHAGCADPDGVRDDIRAGCDPETASLSELLLHWPCQRPETAATILGALAQNELNARKSGESSESLKYVDFRAALSSLCGSRVTETPDAKKFGEMLGKYRDKVIPVGVRTERVTTDDGIEMILTVPSGLKIVGRSGHAKTVRWSVDTVELPDNVWVTAAKMPECGICNKCRSKVDVSHSSPPHAEAWTKVHGGTTPGGTSVGTSTVDTGFSAADAHLEVPEVPEVHTLTREDSISEDEGSPTDVYIPSHYAYVCGSGDGPSSPSGPSKATEHTGIHHDFPGGTPGGTYFGGPSMGPHVCARGHVPAVGSCSLCGVMWEFDPETLKPTRLRDDDPRPIVTAGYPAAVAALVSGGSAPTPRWGGGAQPGGRNGT